MELKINYPGKLMAWRRGGHCGGRGGKLGDYRFVAEGPQDEGDGCISTRNAKSERQYYGKKES